jgi:hypothetical protein
MNIDRLIKIVWLSCGAIFLILMLVGVGALFGVDRWFSYSSADEAGVAIDNQDKERLEKMKLSLNYNSPTKIGTSEFYILPVYILYQESATLKAGMSSDSYRDNSVDQPSNIIFLNKDFDVIRTLLNKKALITKLRYPNQQYYDEVHGEKEKGMNFILYQIAFGDTDSNGQIDSDDHSDLFISELDGNNLLQITNGWNIESFEFHDDYTTILINYTERSDKSKKPTTHFASYHTESKELKKLTKIEEELKTIEQVLIK